MWMWRWSVEDEWWRWRVVRRLAVDEMLAAVAVVPPEFGESQTHRESGTRGGS